MSASLHKSAWKLKSATSDVINLPSIEKFSGQVELPGSKSISNRALLLGALAEGETTISRMLLSDDTMAMICALRHLGVQIHDDNGLYRITGNNGPFRNMQDATIPLNLGNAGTAMRSLAAVLCAGEGHFVLDGNTRMRQRPILDLVNTMRDLKADISCSNNGCPPISINARGIAGGSAKISGKLSSQFISAILLAAPFAQRKLMLEISQDTVSRPYIDMTINMMKQFGVDVDCSIENVYSIEPGKYTSPKTYDIEGDASAATYFLAAGAIAGGPITVRGCGSRSIQGDVRFAEILVRMGVSMEMRETSITVSRSIGSNLIGVEEDCGDIPDAAMTLAVLGMFAKGKTVVKNIYNLRLKESERIKALVTEIRKFGVAVDEGLDYIVVHGVDDYNNIKENVTIETYDDHRMAMAFAIVTCAGKSVNIENPNCTSKTYPTFFQDFRAMCS